MCSVAGPGGPVRVLSISGFHRFLATKLVSSETNKAERGQIVDITLYDLWKCGTAAPGRLCVRTHPLQNVQETWFTTPGWINPARSCRCHGRNGRSWKNACDLY